MPCVETNGPAQKKAMGEVLRLGVSAAFHPFEYSKVLMQLGHEPMPAVMGRGIFCRGKMVLPNYFRYVGHIRRTDGFYGCFRGLAPKLVGSLFSILLSEKIADHLGFNAVEEERDVDTMTDEELYVLFKHNIKRDVVLTISGIVVSHPFRVISLRMMAQFVGRESSYRSIFGSIGEIYRFEGLPGFFSGIIPKLLHDVAGMVLISSTVYLFNKYMIRDKKARQFSGLIADRLFLNMLYPLDLVSTCMTVSGSNIMAGQPPIMPIYYNWLDCYSDLQGRRELIRGKFIFHRFAGGFANAA